MSGNIWPESVTVRALPYSLTSTPDGVFGRHSRVLDEMDQPLLGQLPHHPLRVPSRGRPCSGGRRLRLYLPFLASFLSFFSFTVSLGLFVFAARFLF